jgi:anti-sigma B factor antagonist
VGPNGNDASRSDGEERLAPHLEIEEASIGDAARMIALRGEVDAATVPALRAALNRAVSADGSGVVVDMCDVTFIDSTGLMTLLNALRRVVRRQGRLAIACHNPTVLRLFEVTRTDETFDIFPTREAAVAHVAM